MAEILGRWSVEAGLLARVFWTWWSGELLALVPETVRQTLGGLRKRLVLIIDGDRATLAYEANGQCARVGALSLTAERPTQAATLLSPGTTRRDQVFAARLRLDPGSALQVPMTLPLAALSNLNQVVEFEFERFSPFKRDLVYFRHRVSGRDVENARLDVELTIVPRDLVEDLRWRAEHNGLRITAIDVAGQPLQLPLDAPAGLGRPGSHRAILIASRALLGLAGLMAIGLIVLPFLQNSAKISELTEEMREVKQAADASAALQDAIDNEIHDQSFVIDRKTGSPTVTELMASLTHTLPDDVWLTELQIEGHSLQISGFAASATAVLGLVDQSPLLADAAFRSSVTQDAQLGRERFDISAQIRQKDPP
jgi:general secretion pathway protein L